LTDEQRELLAHAEDSIGAAKVLLESGYPGFSASRSYYAMFYVAEMLLLDRGLSFSKHSTVIAAFGVHYAKTGIVPSEYHRFLMEALSLRHSGDYGQRESVTLEQAQEQIRRAERFLKIAEEQLGQPRQQE
jgi:uncharacterized protein (UPF0332 family)